MSKEVIADVEALWAKVDEAKTWWIDHLTSVQSQKNEHKERSTHSLVHTNATSIATRGQNIYAIKAALEVRLEVLIDLKAARISTLGSIRQLLGYHLPSQPCGPETASSILLRTFDAVDDHLEQAEKNISLWEGHVTQRFETLRSNYDKVVEILAATGALTEVSRTFQKLKAQVEKALEDGKGLDEEVQLSDMIREGQRQNDAAAGFIERQVLNFKANVAFVGVRVARQRLITEFLEK